MKKSLFLIIAVLLIAGCSTKFTYKNIDWLVHWYVDDYIEFNSQQKKAFDEMFSQWQVWHKNEELPKYLDHLNELIADLSTNSMSIERMTYHRKKGRQHWVRIRNHVAPDLVELSSLLSEKQVVYLFAALENDNEEDEERLNERKEWTEDKRKRKWVSSNKDELEDWLGRLNQEQSSFIENSYGNFKPNAELWLQYKRDYQAALRSLFASKQNNSNFESDLLTMLTEPESYRSETLNENSEFNDEKSKEFLQTILSLSTEKQRRKLVDEITEYKEDVLDLLE